MHKILSFFLALLFATVAYGQVQTNPAITGHAAATTAFTVQSSVNRPANTVTHSINAVVGASPTAVITFAGIGPTGGNILVTGADLRVDTAAIPSGMTSFRLPCYNVTPPSAYADNAAWDLGATDRAGFVGYIDLGSPADMGSTLYVQADQVNRQFKLAANDNSLYCYLTTNGSYAPAANSETYTVTLRATSL
jgi:hypothetical protein